MLQLSEWRTKGTEKSTHTHIWNRNLLVGTLSTLRRVRDGVNAEQLKMYICSDGSMFRWRRRDKIRRKKEYYDIDVMTLLLNATATAANSKETHKHTTSAGSKQHWATDKVNGSSWWWRKRIVAAEKWYGSSAKRINFIAYRNGFCIFVLFELLPPS